MIKKKGAFKVSMFVAASSLVLAACGTESTDSKNGSSEGGSESAEITKIVAGTEATFAPFEFMDDKGNVVGIDVDILDAITEEMGIEYEIRNVGWEPVFQQVKNGEIDFGASAITITDERKETFDFTTPYFEATQVLVVKEDSKIASAADVKDKKISVQINSTGHIAAKDLVGETNPNIMAYENLPIAIQEVINGTSEAAIGDNAVVFEYLKNNPDAKLKVIEDDAFAKEYYGFMVKKGNQEVLDLLNEGLEKVKANGKLAEITGQELE
ncbi:MULTISPECIES: basic amino acid ABC transporter substrate-binding protein [Lysinibacillus]|uniref:Basic amino acid ABC transporter substrate-binding protein n=1 Tax=Lysinibacillus antri TaxID=2498145 RepID=A0A3S0P3J4_9BACI|nr:MULTISPECIES: basic amino acid ABC transporter substrate-binding protein [Lysinibacillus]RUL47415.1 basic amino acid ABC transporter substrate-binding protein [Lysinibacillus antri]TSI06990.1 basic amino acid ABC transporter substrate-binding protein [Lysinibacillus sp. BW-2-10]